MKRPGRGSLGVGTVVTREWSGWNERHSLPYTPGSLRSRTFWIASLIDRMSFQRAGLLLFGRMRRGLGSREMTGESNSGTMLESGPPKVSRILFSRRSSSSLGVELEDCTAALAAALIVLPITTSTVSSSYSQAISSTRESQLRGRRTSTLKQNRN